MHRVVIVGGGFGGLQAALHLRSADGQITLVDRRNFHLFQPLAYQVATGALNPGEICYSIRAIFGGHENVRVVLGEVTGFDLETRALPVRTPVGEERFPYDTLIVAGGSKYNYFAHPEWQNVASELKSLEGAIDIRGRILRSLEAAEVEEDEAKRAAYLTFAVVGAGPTGVEMAGQIAEIARDTRRQFRVADTSNARGLLIEAGERVLAGFPPGLSKRAFKALESLGVTPLVNRLVTDLDVDGVVVQSGANEERIRDKTIIWAGGVQAASVSGRLAEAGGAQTDAVGRIMVEPDLTLDGHPGVAAPGALLKARREPPFRRVAPVAMQMGRCAAKLVRGRLRGGHVGDFAY